MAFAIAATLLLVWFQRHVVRRTGSQAINADSVHYRADLLTNLSIIASLSGHAALRLAVARPADGWLPSRSISAGTPTGSAATP